MLMSDHKRNKKSLIYGEKLENNFLTTRTILSIKLLEEATTKAKILIKKRQKPIKRPEILFKFQELKEVKALERKLLAKLNNG